MRNFWKFNFVVAATLAVIGCGTEEMASRVRPTGTSISTSTNSTTPNPETEDSKYEPNLILYSTRLVADGLWEFTSKMGDTREAATSVPLNYMIPFDSDGDGKDETQNFVQFNFDTPGKAPSLKWKLRSGREFSYGAEMDYPVAGDWAGTKGGARWQVGSFRGADNYWSLDADASYTYDGNIDPTFKYGYVPASQPDFLKHGYRAANVPTPGVWQKGRGTAVGTFSPQHVVWWLDLDYDRVVDADECFAFGGAGDHPLVGDWNNDGIDEIGGA